jgi:hypothetical protein
VSKATRQLAVTTTLRRFAVNRFAIDHTTACYLADLGGFQDKQELSTQQSPQRLNVLREQQNAGVIVCRGRGPEAIWAKPEGTNQGNELPPD